MGKCYLCETEQTDSYFGYWCKDCRRIRHLINLYGLEKVGEVLERVLVRDTSKQEHKIRDCLKDEIEVRKYNLRNKPVIKVEEEVD